MAGTIQPTKIGYRVAPPRVVLYYKDTSSGKSRRRQMPIDEKLSASNPAAASEALQDKHFAYLQGVPTHQLERLVKTAVSGVETAGVDTTFVLHAPQEDFTNADDDTIEAHKAKMDLLFEQQQQKALAKGYVHDVQVDFGDGDEDAGWDSD